MKIKLKANRNFLTTVLLSLCCIYYLTYKFWDVRARGFKYLILVTVMIGIMGYIITLMKSKHSDFGKTRFFIMFILLESIFLIYSLAAKNSSQRMLALYQYCFYTLIFCGCIYYTRKANVEKVFNILRYIGVMLSVLSIFELISKKYFVPVDEWYGKVNYGGSWFLRAKVFSGSPMVYGLIMALLSIIAFDKYHKSKKMVDLLVFVIDIVGLAASFSRGPYVSFVVGIIVYILIDEKTNRKKVFKYIFGSLIFIAVLVIVIEVGSKTNPTLSLLKARLFSIFQWSGSATWSSNSSRLSIWRDSVKVLFDGSNWLTGIGAAATGARTMDSGGFVTESGLLRRLVEFGIPVALFFYTFLIGIIRFGYEKSKKSGNPYLMLEVAAIVCILVEDVTLQITEEISITFFLWFFIALLLTYKPQNAAIMP